MMSGKVVSRALWGHFLIEAALTTTIISSLLPDEALLEESTGHSCGDEGVAQEDTSGDEPEVLADVIAVKEKWKMVT